MMLGRRDAFEYLECPGCGCVQIAEYPESIESYYPSSYYSMTIAARRIPVERVERWLRKRRAAYALGQGDPIGRALGRVLGLAECYDWLRFAGMGFESAILDVGCGNGFLLSMLWRDGFTKLEGVDPFTTEVSRGQPGFVIRNTLDEVERRPDFILLSHSLEHMPEQRSVLDELRSIAGPQTQLCVRLPLATEAFRRYREHWVQLDPPRHYYLHTPSSFTELARASGFEVVRRTYDSTAFQFWGSELYRLDIPLSDPRSVGRAHGGASAIFGRTQVEAWKREAEALNRAERGDQATFFLRPSDTRAPTDAPIA
jgi:SAM-dependent methyltransferase